MMTTTEQGFSLLSPATVESVRALDLRTEAQRAFNRAADSEIWHRSVTRERDGVRAECLYFADNGRVGLALTGDALWGDASTGGPLLALCVDVSDDGVGEYLDCDGYRLCCYSGCYERAAVLDLDGDHACVECAAHAVRWVECVHPDATNALADEQLASAFVAQMRERGYRVEVLVTTREAEGTHYRHDDGTMSAISSLFEPRIGEAYKEDSRRVYDAVCSHSRECAE